MKPNHFFSLAVLFFIACGTEMSPTSKTASNPTPEVPTATSSSQALPTTPDFSIQLPESFPSSTSVEIRDDRPIQHILEGQQLYAVSHPNKETGFSFHIEDGATPAVFALRYFGPVKGLKIMGDADLPPGDLAALTKKVVAGAKTDKEKAKAIFHFVANEFPNWWYPAEGYGTIQRSPRNVGKQLWGYGYGLCSDSAQIAVAMWREIGLPSKITLIQPFHTVASVQYNGQWHLFDLQHRSYWEKPDGSVASGEELAANPNLFYQNLDALGLDPIGYPPGLLASWYSKGTVVHTPGDFEVARDFGLDLREGEFFEINYVGKPYIYHPEMWLQYYGETTITRNPPWPVKGSRYYVPSWYNKPVQYQTITLPNGRTAYVVTMTSPYLFSQGWMRAHSLPDEPELYIFAHDRYHYVGPLIAKTGDLGDAIKGTYRFAVCISPNEPYPDPAAALANLEIRAYTQMSPLGLPRLKSGQNSIPVDWQLGQPLMALWYKEHAPDLVANFVQALPTHPKAGELVNLVFSVENRGSGPSETTPAAVYNLATGLFTEGLDEIGQISIPPLIPGEKTQVSITWRCTTRQTAYGQNPHLQLIDFWVDKDKTRAETNRTNNRVQHWLHLALPSGDPAPLPGYGQ